MRLLCNGVALDLLSGAALSFKKSNPLFAFDALTCERTQSFDIPATPHNERVMQLAKLPAFRGEGMRRRFDAELQDGIVVKRGYLYVDAYNNDKYKAIFVTGELFGLQAIRDAGKINNFLQYNSALIWNLSNVKPANATNIDPFDLVAYISDAGESPSVLLTKIMNDALAQIGQQIVWPQSDMLNHLRIFNAGGLKIENVDIRFKNTPGQQEPIIIAPFLGIVNYTNHASYTYNVVCVPDPPYEPIWEYRSAYPLDMFQEPSIPWDCTLTFPEDFPVDMFLASGELLGNHYRLPNTNEPWTDFLGGYSFRIFGNRIITSGEPLTGRTVNIPANTPFVLISKNGLHFTPPTTIGQTGSVYYDAEAIGAYDFGLKITINHEFVNGDNTPYNAIMPGITIVELAKVVAALTGTVLNYDGTLRFDPLAFDTWETMHITECTSEDEIARKFADFAQRNIVRYNSGESVNASERKMVVYTIDNDNIEEEKELQTLSVSEGGMQMAAEQREGQVEYVEYIKVRGTENNSLTVALTGDYVRMTRTSLPKITGLQTLCDASTSVNIKVRMTLAQYERMSAKTAILYRGTRYVWTEATWSKEVATLKLSKIL